jgi:hypothetical protein
MLGVVGALTVEVLGYGNWMTVRPWPPGEAISVSLTAPSG